VNFLLYIYIYLFKKDLKFILKYLLKFDKCENKNNWKKTKLADLKKALEMTKKPQFKEFVEILLEFTIEEFHFLKSKIN